MQGHAFISRAAAKAVGMNILIADAKHISFA